LPEIIEIPIGVCKKNDFHKLIYDQKNLKSKNSFHFF